MENMKKLRGIILIKTETRSKLLSKRKYHTTIFFENLLAIE